MNDAMFFRNVESQLINEIGSEKGFSLKKLWKIIELDGILNADKH